jgi:hypothetical protein
VLGELFMATTTKTGMRLLLRHGNPRELPAQHFDHVFESVDQGTRRAVLSLYRNTRNMEEAARQLTAALRPLDLPALIIWALTIRTSRSHLRSASARYSHTLR